MKATFLFLPPGAAGSFSLARRKRKNRGRKQQAWTTLSQLAADSSLTKGSLINPPFAPLFSAGKTNSAKSRNCAIISGKQTFFYWGICYGCRKKENADISYPYRAGDRGCGGAGDMARRPAAGARGRPKLRPYPTPEVIVHETQVEKIVEVEKEVTARSLRRAAGHGHAGDAGILFHGRHLLFQREDPVPSGGGLYRVQLSRQL